MENLKNTLANPFSKVQAMEESVLDQIVNQQIYTIHDHVQPYYISSMKSLVTNIQQKVSNVSLSLDQMKNYFYSKHMQCLIMM